MQKAIYSILVGIIIGGMFFATTAWSQNVSGSVKGTVVDQAGAAVPVAKATLTNSATGLAFSASSNTAGILVFPSVGAGTYTLAVQAPGFRQYVRTSIDLTSGEIRELGTLALQIGDVKESVEVNDVATPLQLASGEKSGLVSGSQLNDLALKGRDFLALTATMPGVIDTNSATRDATTPNSLGGIYINGTRTESKNFTVDGITDMDTGSNGAVHFEPNMDSIAEVKVLSSNYQAEYGRNAGGTISVITKGGGQEFHGSGWWTHRHEQFNSNNFFNNSSGLARTPYRYNIAGFSVGGPVYIPHAFNSDRSKVFFFVSQEYTRQLVNNGTNYINMPSTLERQGNFSKSVDVSGKLIPVKDPTTGAPFPGNIIPLARINSYGQAILNFYPTPNYVDPNPSLVNQRNYIIAASGSHPRRNDMIRTDVAPTNKLRGNFRWIRDVDTTLLPFQGNNFGVPFDHPNPGHGYAANVTYVINPRILNEFIIGKSWNSWLNYPSNPSQVNRSVVNNLPQWYANSPSDSSNQREAADALLMPNLVFGGTPVSPPTLNINNQQHTNHNDTWDFIENFSYVLGNHQFKTGFYLNLTDKVQVQGASWNGVLNFATNSNNPNDSGNAYANALLGNFNNYSESTRGINFHAKYWGLEFFAQDNWRVTRKLSLDYGIRFYQLSPQHDLNETLAAFSQQAYDPTQVPRLYRPVLNSQGQRVGVDPLTGAQVPAPLIGAFVPGSGSFANGMIVGGQNGVPGGLYTIGALSATPRLGFAYDVSGKGKAVIRGGFGIFVDRFRQLINNNTTANPPLTYTPTAYYGNLSTFAQASGAIGPSVVTSIAPISGAKNPSVMNYSLGIQKQLPFATVVDIAYVGNLSRHNVQTRNVNPIPLFAQFDPANTDPTTKGQPLPNNFYRPYMGLSDINNYEFASSANYNSLQISVQRRMTKNFGFGASFTFSKALGVASAYGNSVSSYFDPRSYDYGPLTFDRSKAFVLNYMYDLPDAGKKLGNRYVSAIISKWSLSGVTSFIAGSPFTPTFTTTVAQNTTGSSDGARITVLSNPQLDKSQKSFSRNFETKSFGLTPVRSFGNAGVGILRGPGLNNWDISLNKRFPVGLGEKRTLQFRLEAYNVFNHTQFTGLNTTARFNPTTGEQVNAAFGQFTSAAPGRILSLALRFRF